MLDLLKKIDLLEYFTFAEIILHVVFFDSFNGYLLACQLMNSKRYLTKRTFANKFHKLIKIKCCWRQFIVLFDILLNILYKLISLLQNGIVYPSLWLFFFLI